MVVLSSHGLLIAQYVRYAPGLALSGLGYLQVSMTDWFGSSKWSSYLLQLYDASHQGSQRVLWTKHLDEEYVNIGKIGFVNLDAQLVVVTRTGFIIVYNTQTGSLAKRQRLSGMEGNQIIAEAKIHQNHVVASLIGVGLLIENWVTGQSRRLQWEESGLPCHAMHDQGAYIEESGDLLVRYIQNEDVDRIPGPVSKVCYMAPRYGGQS